MRKSRIVCRAAVAALAFAALGTDRACADDKNFAVGEGDWNNIWNWTPAGIPGGGTYCWINWGRKAHVNNDVPDVYQVEVGQNSGDGGHLVVNNNGRLDISAWLIVGRQRNGTLDINAGGKVYANGQTRMGEFEGYTGIAWVGGYLQSPIFNIGVRGTGTMDVENGGTVRANDWFVLGEGSAAQGTVTVYSGGWFGAPDRKGNTSYVGNSGKGTLNVNEGGTVQVADTLRLNYNDSTRKGTINNSGTIRVGNLYRASGSVYTDTSSGTLLVNTLSGSGWNNQTFNGKLWLGWDQTASNTVSSGVNWTVNQEFRVGHTASSTLTIANNGNVTVNGWAYLGYQSGAPGTLNVNAGGTLRNTVGMIGFASSSSGNATVAGTWNNTTDLTVGNSGNGTLTVNSGGNVTSTSFIGIGRNSGATGTVTVNAGGSLSAGTFMGVGYMDVGERGVGTLNVSGGNVTVGTTLYVGNGDAVNLSGGKLQAQTVNRYAGSTFNFTGGTLHVGTFNGNLVNAGGTLAPGASPGLTTVNGDYTQGGTSVLAIELGGSARGSEYDALDVTGTLTLDGVLNVSLWNGYDPSIGDTFNILSWGSRAGTFSTVNLPDLSGGKSWDQSALYTTGEISVIPEPASILAVGFGLLPYIVLRRIRRNACNSPHTPKGMENA